MKKSSFLFGISLSSILAVTGANAAGYTCEELIEYTSCSPGYTLQTVCSQGATLYTNQCCDGYDYDNKDFNCNSVGDATQCDDEMVEVIFVEELCVTNNNKIVEKVAEVNGCEKCPIGYTCAGSTNAAAPCPAGSYCATAGLSEPSGVCAVGTFAGTGAITCTTCPATGLTDINGNVVNATTTGAGATSITACIVGSDSQFKDTKGTYHYKSKCSFDLATIMINGEEECAAIGGEWTEDADVYCSLPDSFIPQSMDACEDAGLYWDEEVGCVAEMGCDAGDGLRVYADIPGVTCW